jgi:metallophosphoesterase superfamily enzyme
MDAGNALPNEDKFSSIADIMPQILRRKSILKTSKDRPLILDDLHVGKEQAAKQKHRVRERRLATTYLNS